MTYATPSMAPHDTVDAIHDLHLDATGNLAMSYGGDAVAEHARWRTKTFQGEWEWDIEAGIPWLQQIMGRAADIALFDTIVKAEIANTAGVRAITEFSARFDRSRRAIVVDRATITTEDGSEARL